MTERDAPGQPMLEVDMWRLRRLAELGVAQAKINHDLRNMMTSALMVADRLQGSADPKVSRAGALLVSSIERATALIAGSQAFTMEPAPQLVRSRFALAALIEEVAETLRTEHEGLIIENTTPENLHLEADRAEFGRALGHLLRTAAKAEAQRVTVHGEAGTNDIAIMLSDDGRPFRNVTDAAAFQPFSGGFRYGSTGMGFVIARDVIEAHGGSITARTNTAQTGDAQEDRTCIVITLPT